MSKNKMTIEERLEEALVPVEEQPYQVPENWVWTSIDSVTKEIKNGTTQKQNKEGKGQPVTRIESIQNNDVDQERLGYIEDITVLKDSDYYLPNDIVLSHINSLEHVGKTAVIKEEYLPLLHGMNLLRIRTFKEKINPKYLQYYMRSYQFRKDVRNKVNQAVNQVSLNQKKLKEIAIPLVPLNEQKRIADKVESLLNKIDEAKQLIEEAKESFELRRAAILDKGFRGELTSTWRMMNHYESKTLEFEDIKIDELLERFPRKENREHFPESWKLTDINEVCSDSFYGPRFSKGDYSTNGGFPTVRTTDMTKDGEIELNNPPYVVVSDERLEAFKLVKGDFLVTRTGSIGTMAVFNGDYEAIPSAYLIRFRFKENIHPKFIFYYLKSPIGQQMLGLGATAITQSNINAKTIKSMPLFIPPLDEQEKIVEILDGYFHKEKQIYKLLQRDDFVHQLRSSLLNKAFRGELGTYDSTEESAIELLKEVLQEK